MNAGRPTSDAAAADDALDAEALVVGEALERRQLAELVARRAGDRLRDRVLGGVLDRAGDGEHLGAVLGDARRPGSCARW